MANKLIWTFNSIESSDLEVDNLLTALTETVTAIYDSPSIESLIFAGKEIPQRSLVLQRSEFTGDPSDDILTATALISNTGPSNGAPADNDDPVKWGKSVYFVNEFGYITISDDNPIWQNGMRDLIFGLTVIQSPPTSPTNFIVVPIGEIRNVTAAPGTYVDGVFGSLIQPKFVQTSTNKAAREINVSPGSEVRVTYREVVTDMNTWITTESGISSIVNTRVQPLVPGINTDPNFIEMLNGHIGELTVDEQEKIRGLNAIDFYKL